MSWWEVMSIIWHALGSKTYPGAPQNDPPKKPRSSQKRTRTTRRQENRTKSPKGGGYPQFGVTLWGAFGHLKRDPNRSKKHPKTRWPMKRPKNDPRCSRRCLGALLATFRGPRGSEKPSKFIGKRSIPWQITFSTKNSFADGFGTNLGRPKPLQGPKGHPKEGQDDPEMRPRRPPKSTSIFDILQGSYAKKLP